MRRIIALYLLPVVCMLCLSTYVYAGGLSTAFGEIVFRDVEMGFRRSNSMEAEYGSPLTIQNTSDRDLDLKIEPIYPREDELVEGYEAIPDLSWITVEQQDFHVPAGTEAATDIIITVPMAAEYAGKKYQAYIWSRTVGLSLGAGLKSRLLFSVKE